jgi:para-aminobenzoate synthetase component 1
MGAATITPFEAVPVPVPEGGPLVVELIPAPDPWTVACQLAHLPHLLFLDSADRHPNRGRYSYVTAVSGGFICGPSCEENPFTLPETGFPFARFQMVRLPELPPFQGGLAGLFGYGLCRWFEKVPRSRWDEFDRSDLKLGGYDWVISFDHQQNRAWIVSTGFPMQKPTDRVWRAGRQLRFVLSHLRQHLRPPEPVFENLLPVSDLYPQHPLPGFPGVTSNFDRAGYEAAVSRTVEYIHAGDCFQVNLSQRLLAPLREHPLDLYGRLRANNPAPFGAYFDAGEFQILSASPERFLKVENGEVVTRPIKGTRPRGQTPAEDAALLDDLVSSPKDRAENVMIVDLLRNDLGRVCEYGSVRVPRVCEVETFRYVHHLVSEVRGKLRPECGPLELLRAAFPGGSVTGAPKVRAMEIIAELEPTARGPYCGSLGFIGFDGTMDTNILIRTFTAGRGWVQFPVGGGIVADSDPQREYDETLHKAAGLLSALHVKSL